MSAQSDNKSDNKSDNQTDNKTASLTARRDSLFASPMGSIEAFSFNQSVVDVFPDMLKRSVPGYEAIIKQSALLASRYAQPHTRLYDLGSSLGATSMAMRDALLAADPIVQGCEVHAIDNSAAMVHECRQRVVESPIPILVHEADLQTHPISNASVVAMNFTLQFVQPDARASLMAKIAQALQPGGALILSEKVCFADPVVDTLHIDMYHEFKRANGYSDLEISQKRNALETVLVPDTLDTHHERLINAGFTHVSIWFQCFNFASLIAIKT